MSARVSRFLTAAALLIPVVASAADRRPVVVVFDVEARGINLRKDMLVRLSDYLASRLAESGEFMVVPRDQLKQRLIDQKAKSYKKCYDEKCQIELGREMAADKTLSTQVIKLGSKCMVTSTLYDLKQAAAGRAATVRGKCSEDEIVSSIDKAVEKLTEAERKREAEARQAEEEKRRGEAKERERTARIEAEKDAAKENERGMKIDKSREVRQPGTELHWLRCPLGANWDGSSCQGKTEDFSWDKAMKACPSGYRLPSKEEFVALLGSSKIRKYIFGKDELFYWSSSILNSSDAFAGFFKEGFIGSTKRVNRIRVRCVRVGPATAGSKDSNDFEREALSKAWESVKDVAFNKEFGPKTQIAELNKFLSDFPKDNIYEQEAKALITLTRLGELKQPWTDLYWLRCPLGQTWSGSSCQGDEIVTSWNEAMICPGGYRLPTRQEFMSLLGNCDANARDGRSGFCSTCAKSEKCSSMFGEDKKFYWSSSVAGQSDAWRIMFNEGLIHELGKSIPSYIRCVRGGA